jgi:hypothetical protein
MIIRIHSVIVLTLCICGMTSLSNETARAQNAEAKNQTSTLEGVLKVHPKFLFKYYITGFGDGQECALFGEDKLKNVKPGSTIRVEGHLGTRFHEGGSEKNPSPFPRTWIIYMDVDSVTVLREPEKTDKTGGPPH